MNSSKGMTLLEVLLALFIFATASVFITQAIQSIFKKQKKIEFNIKDQRIKENSFRFIQKDLQHLIYSLDIDSYLKFQFNEAEIDFKSYIYFEGTSNTVSFLSMPDSKSGILQITYDLQKCQKGYCLTRYIKVYPSNKIKNSLQVVRKIKDLKITYYDQIKQSWVSEWNGQERWAEEAKNNQNEMYSILPAKIKFEIKFIDDSVSDYLFFISSFFMQAYNPIGISPLVHVNSETVEKSKPKALNENK